jgi:hypothetical protein
MRLRDEANRNKKIKEGLPVSLNSSRFHKKEKT